MLFLEIATYLFDVLISTLKNFFLMDLTV